jgi:hypothetical protein
MATTIAGGRRLADVDGQSDLARKQKPSQAGQEPAKAKMIEGIAPSSCFHINTLFTHIESPAMDYKNTHGGGEVLFRGGEVKS